MKMSSPVDAGVTFNVVSKTQLPPVDPQRDWAPSFAGEALTIG